ncbi:MAG: hypothetical protein MUO22_02810 [Sedimentisphaerales bacterium]|nr:hypothetical protein [Sedimentisphaerales bacterium]
MKILHAKTEKALLAIFFCIASLVKAGPYAPPAEEPNSTAIYMDDPNFVAWATGITVQRGYVNISEPGLGYVSYGNDSNALRKADGDSYGVVSLGDGGNATVTFANPIANGPGYDFAVFENAFDDTFLELAFVEVSSDGIHFFGFDSVSLTQTNTQVGGFGTLDTTDLHNLAGKYQQGYGTPFDLEELADVNSLLDVNSITHVRIIDVVGFVEPADFYGDGIVDFFDHSIFAAAYMSGPDDENWNQNCDISEPVDNIIDMLDFVQFVSKWLNENDYASYDSQGHQINDPWPTDFPTGGFDLDAVGVINEKTVVE